MTVVDTSDGGSSSSPKVESYSPAKSAAPNLRDPSPIRNPRRLSLHNSHHQKRSLLHFNNRRASVPPPGSVISDSEGTLTPPAVAPYQSLGMRTKRYFIPRLLSKRKFALALLHPQSAAVMNDIHYLLKAHIKPKAHFQEVDNVFLRTLIKIGIVAQQLQYNAEAVSQMRRIEKLAHRFCIAFQDISMAAEAASPSSSAQSDVTVLMDILSRLRISLLDFVGNNLSANSMNRIELVFQELENVDFWRKIFDIASNTHRDWQLVRNLRTSFNALVDAKLL